MEKTATRRIQPFVGVNGSLEGGLSRNSATSKVVFFNQDWVAIGDRSSITVAVSVITGIGDLANFEAASVAQKMSCPRERPREWKI
jgi:hypothetical protein